jgi:hypothetical protein
MPNGFHTHRFDGMTLIADRHNHGYFGRTSREPDTMGHTHIMEGTTTMDDVHTHLYHLRTGPSIHRNGGHYHCYDGDTDVSDRHTHGMRGCTSID